MTIRYSALEARAKATYRLLNYDFFLLLAEELSKEGLLADDNRLRGLRCLNRHRLWLRLCDLIRLVCEKEFKLRSEGLESKQAAKLEYFFRKLDSEERKTY